MDQHDNVRVLQQQRKDAREEIERIQRWLETQKGSSLGWVLVISEIHSKLDRVRNVILREDI